MDTSEAISVLLATFDLLWVFAKASAQLKLDPPFSSSVGALASAENVCFADSDAPAIAALDYSEGGMITVEPG